MTRAPSDAPDTGPAAPLPRLLDAVGILAVAGGALTAVLLAVRAPFDGPWLVVAAVAAVFAGLYAGFLAMGFAANLRVLDAIRRRLAERAAQGRAGQG
ncbi:hypothetical protein [Azospirillum sp. A39]|uniref:hypothetical protein n=1 Tax=Azospirillum sp. A39 TaxID=3462279 RepID=UPI0040451CA5